MPSLASLVRLVLPRRCVACRRPGEWMCDECGAAHARARRAAVRALRRADRTRRRGLPRLRAAALAHDGALGALARRARCSTLVARWKRGEIAPGAAGGGARRARAAAAAGRRDRGRAGRARPAARCAAPIRPPSWPPSSRAGGTCRSCRSCDRTRGVRPQRGLDAAARRRNVRGAFAARAGPALAGARRRRLHDGSDGRRVRPRAAPGGRGRGARDHARAHAARSVLCARRRPVADSQ